MKHIGREDFFQTRRLDRGHVFDLPSFVDCYLPLLGSDAFSMYLALRQNKEAPRTYRVFLEGYGWTIGEFEKAMRILEAIGLVQTYEIGSEESRLFEHRVKAPLDAIPFLENILLAGHLRKKVGEERFAEIQKKYAGEEPSASGEDISTSFTEVFHNDGSPDFYLKSALQKQSKKKALAKTGFDLVDFCRIMESRGYRHNLLDEQELYDIEMTAALYDYSEETMADFCVDCLVINRPYGHRLDRNALSKKTSAGAPFLYLKEEKKESSNVSSETQLAKKIELMDLAPTSDFLAVLHDGHRPALADLRIAERLHNENGLPIPCVNALMDYAMEKSENGIINYAYCDRIAAGMVRAGCKTARDAMDYLKRPSLKRGKENEKKPVQSQGISENIHDLPQKEAKNKDEVSDEELDALFAEMKGKKK